MERLPMEQLEGKELLYSQSSELRKVRCKITAADESIGYTLQAIEKKKETEILYSVEIGDYLFCIHGPSAPKKEGIIPCSKEEYARAIEYLYIALEKGIFLVSEFHLHFSTDPYIEFPFRDDPDADFCPFT